MDRAARHSPDLSIYIFPWSFLNNKFFEIAITLEKTKLNKEITSVPILMFRKARQVETSEIAFNNVPITADGCHFNCLNRYQNNVIVEKDYQLILIK